MATDAHATAEFYATTRGGVVARLLRGRLARIWPDLRGRSVLGVGYAQPYLRLWREQAGRCVAALPAQAGPGQAVPVPAGAGHWPPPLPAPWPPSGASLCCVVEEDALPFPDLSFDCILLLHGLEAAEHARRMLREAWRVLKDDGRLLVVVPNRRGMWAHVESTPFGQGQPYSRGQIDRLLAAALFRVERRDTALYVPPTRLRMVLRGAPLWEKAGRALMPNLAGVTITEACKDVYAALPAQAPARRRLVLARTTAERTAPSPARQTG